MAKLRLLLVASSLWQRFVLHYTDVAALHSTFLINMHLKNLLELNYHEGQPVSTLMQALFLKQILTYPLPNLPCTVNADASDSQVEATLFTQDKHEHFNPTFP